MLTITRASKQPLPPITMRNRLWSESWCSDWPVCCGGYDEQPPSRPVFSKSKRTISVTSERRTKSRLARVRSFMRFSMQIPFGDRLQDCIRLKAKLLPMSSLHVVSCGSAICPIMPFTASVAMKLSFGPKPGRFCLRSTIWIAANRRREGGVSVLVVDNHSQPSGATSVEASIASRPSLQRSKDHVSDHVPRHRRVNDSLRASLVPSLLLWQN